MSEDDGYATVDAEVPLSEMFDIPQFFAPPHKEKQNSQWSFLDMPQRLVVFKKI